MYLICYNKRGSKFYSQLFVEEQSDIKTKDK